MNRSLEDIQTQILALVQQFLIELESKKSLHNITMDAYLDKDLGIDSLGKIEFLHRLEKHFAVRLPEHLVGEAETLADLAKAIYQAVPEKKIKPQQIIPPLEQAKIDLSSAKTLVDVLHLYAKKLPDRIHIYLQDENGEESIITYGKLYESAVKVARGLTELGLKKSETVAIMLPTSGSFFYAFFGVLLAGGIPVPIYPPFRPDRIGEYALRESTILKNAEVRFLITFHNAEVMSRLLRVFISSLKSIVTVEELMARPGKNIKVKYDSQDAGLIQYTSGSTSMPKGVLLSNANLLANIHAYGNAINVQKNDLCVSWLPLYHDMGLIGAWLGSFFYGSPAVIMSPLSFLMRPERWLWTIHYHQGTISAGPNFAYELCIKKINEDDIEGLDLSTWRLAFNGAEAVNPNTLKRFYEKFKPYGFKEESLHPVYGLAESSVALTFPSLDTKPRFDRIKREPFENEGKAFPINDTNVKNEKYIEFVGCGFPLEKHEIRIVDEKNNPLEERHIGNLQFRGPSAMQGYFRNKKATDAIYHDGWWETGDIAYIADNELFPVGRKKDIIIKAGRNYYPEEIEEITNQVPGIRKGCTVAFGVEDAHSGTEKLIIVTETAAEKKSVKANIISEVIEKVSTVLGVPPDQVILVPPRSIPKTSSGKLRRSTAKADYLKGKIKKPPLPFWMQIGKLVANSSVIKLRSFISTVGKFIYTIYVYLLAALLFPFIWSSIMLPKQKTAQKLVHFWSRFVFRLLFCPITVKGKHNIPKDKPVVYTANHVSYLDSIVLLGVLPYNILIVAKSELKKAPIIKSFFKKLGHPLVERFDFTKSIEDAEKIQNILSDGNSIVIFPEGTFSYVSGLRPFKLGAFKMAAETSSLICPIAINGTRKILRSQSRLLRPSRIIITISECLTPKNKDWEEIVRLRSLTRKEIAKHCGEDILNV